MMTQAAASRTARVLGLIERAGNALPHPATLFAVFAALVIVVSAIASGLRLTATHPGTGALVQPVSLLSIDGVHRILTGMVSNYTGYAPLGTVLVALLGLAVAEGSGLIGAALRLVVLAAPPRVLTFAIVFAGVMSNTGGEIGYVLLLPLAAMTFLAVGRHPLVGFAAAFAGVSGGYSANLLLGTVDPLLAGMSEEAAHLVDPAYRVNPACNYFFMAASTFVISTVGTLVTERVVAPRLGIYCGEGATTGEFVQPLSASERRGLSAALGTLLVFAALLTWGVVPESGFLRDPETRGVLRSPFMSGIVALIFFAGLVAGLAYGLAARTIKSDRDVVTAMARSMETYAVYLVLVFFAAQFVAFFNWSNLGLILAIKGAEALRALGLGTVPLVISLVLVSAFINMFMGSASAKWAIMAPVFVPMFMLLGYTPEFTQAAYRVGDSITNIISPMMSYFALAVAFMQRYQPDAGIGTVVATMLPYTVAFFLSWTGLLVLWIVFGLPLGPGAGMYL